MTLDAAWFVAPEIFEREQRDIFRVQWLCVGREESLARAGDFFTVKRAGESLIVTRGDDGRIRAFFNVCRHRGTRLCERESGRFSGSIQCPYHAWTYRLDGTLAVARNMSEVAGFDRTDYPLTQAAVALWDGFVFVNLSPGAHAADFERAFAPLLGRFDRWGMRTLSTSRAIRYELACNWKLVFLNYCECYHCPLVHPQLERLSPSDSGRNDLSEGPFLGGYSELRERGASLTTSGKSARAPVGTVDGADLERVYYYTIFPSMLLSLHPDYVMVHYCNPLAVDRTEIICAWLFSPHEMARPDFDPGDAVDFWDLTNRQDWHVNELTHSGMQSCAYVRGPYSNAEGLLGAFDRYYLQCMGSERDA